MCLAAIRGASAAQLRAVDPDASPHEQRHEEIRQDEASLRVRRIVNVVCVLFERFRIRSPTKMNKSEGNVCEEHDEDVCSANRLVGSEKCGRK